MHTCCAGRCIGAAAVVQPQDREDPCRGPGLLFANGVALSRDESFIAVVETNTQTVHRVWLAGAKVRRECSVACWNQVSRQ